MIFYPSLVSSQCSQYEASILVGFWRSKVSGCRNKHPDQDQSPLLALTGALGAAGPSQGPRRALVWSLNVDLEPEGGGFQTAFTVRPARKRRPTVAFDLCSFLLISRVLG